MTCSTTSSRKREEQIEDFFATCDIWYLTYDTGKVTCDMWHMEGGEHYLKMSGLYLIWFGSECDLKIFPHRMSDWINESMNEKGVCRTASATLGLLIIIFKHRDLHRVGFSSRRAFYNGVILFSLLKSCASMLDCMQVM